MVPATNTYSLTNYENYKSFLENSLNDIVDKYIALICEYLRFISENIKLKKKGHFRFILTRGLETITHVFNNILLYTKNLEMAYYHGQKAFYYYVEFIGQISEEQNMFLQLSSRDATLYVYKKTIYEINNEHKKIATCKDEKIEEKLAGSDIRCQIYKNIVNYFLICDEQLEKQDITEFITRFETICYNMNSIILSNDESKTIHFFLLCLNEKSIDIKKYFDILDLFMKRICKMQNILCEQKIKEKYLHDSFDKMVQQNPDKFISWIFS